MAALNTVQNNVLLVFILRMLLVGAVSISKSGKMKSMRDPEIIVDDSGQKGGMTIRAAFYTDYAPKTLLEDVCNNIDHRFGSSIKRKEIFLFNVVKNLYEDNISIIGNPFIPFMVLFYNEYKEMILKQIKITKEVFPFLGEYDDSAMRLRDIGKVYSEFEMWKKLRLQCASQMSKEEVSDSKMEKTESSRQMDVIANFVEFVSGIGTSIQNINLVLLHLYNIKLYLGQHFSNEKFNEMSIEDRLATWKVENVKRWIHNNSMRNSSNVYGEDEVDSQTNKTLEMLFPIIISDSTPTFIQRALLLVILPFIKYGVTVPNEVDSILFDGLLRDMLKNKVMNFYEDTLENYPRPPRADLFCDMILLLIKQGKKNLVFIYLDAFLSHLNFDDQCDIFKKINGTELGKGILENIKWGNTLPPLI